MKKTIKDWVEAISFAVVICVILFFICWPYKINGSSMEPSFYTGDRIVISRVIAQFGTLETGDSVVCEVMINGEEMSLVKRIIGVPGDSIKISDGKVYLNNVELNEDYLGNTTTDGNIDIVLQKDEYFILGDNRFVSVDSRKFGPITKDDIQGKVIAKWFPINSFEIY